MNILRFCTILKPYWAHNLRNSFSKAKPTLNQPILPPPSLQSPTHILQKLIKTTIKSNETFNCFLITRKWKCHDHRFINPQSTKRENIHIEMITLHSLLSSSYSTLTSFSCWYIFAAHSICHFHFDSSRRSKEPRKNIFLYSLTFESKMERKELVKKCRRKNCFEGYFKVSSSNENEMWIEKEGKEEAREVNVFRKKKSMADSSSVHFFFFSSLCVFSSEHWIPNCVLRHLMVWLNF